MINADIFALSTNKCFKNPEGGDPGELVSNFNELCKVKDDLISGGKLLDKLGVVLENMCNSKFDGEGFGGGDEFFESDHEGVSEIHFSNALQEKVKVIESIVDVRKVAAPKFTVNIKISLLLIQHRSQYIIIPST